VEQKALTDKKTAEIERVILWYSTPSCRPVSKKTADPEVGEKKGRGSRKDWDKANLHERASFAYYVCLCGDLEGAGEMWRGKKEGRNFGRGCQGVGGVLPRGQNGEGEGVAPSWVTLRTGWWGERKMPV